MKDSFLNRKFKYSYNNAVLWIIVANLVVYLLTYALKVKIHDIELYYYLGLSRPGIHLGYIWQFVTYMFVHARDFTHILLNMYTLLLFGTMVERILGTKEFLLFYFVSGILSGVLGYLLNIFFGVNALTYGASGAIYALLFLCAVMFPKSRVLIFFFIPMRMPIAVLIFAVIEIIDQVFGVGTNVAHLFHLSGFLVSWLYCLVRFRVSPFKVWRSALGDR